MRFVFLHGGPGFNSYAEQAILGPIVQSHGQVIECWNEPSRLRPMGDPFEPERAFASWLASAERFVVNATRESPAHLVAHSVTVHAAAEIARRQPGRVASLVLLAPSVDTFATFTNILKLAHNDLVDHNPEIASTIAGSLTRTRAVLDEAMREGLQNALLDDRLMTHYWTDPEQLRLSVAAAGSRPEAQFDVDSFFAVLSDLGAQGSSWLSRGDVRAPTLALFGALDPVSPCAEQRNALLAAIPHARIEVLDGRSHYLHLDRPQHLVDRMVDWAQSLPG